MMNLFDHAKAHGWYEHVENVVTGGMARFEEGDSHFELEVRFGRHDLTSASPKYHAGISSNAYQRLLQRHMTTYPSFIVSSEHTLISRNDGTTIHLDLDRKVATEKRKISRHDVIDWAFRVQGNLETPLSSIEYQQLLAKTDLREHSRRHRNRSSFWLVPRTWRLDITEVMTYQPGNLFGEPSWEAELEYCGDFRKDMRLIVVDLIGITQSLLQMIQDSYHPITAAKANQLESLVQQMRQTAPFLGRVQPRTINRNDLSSKVFNAQSEYGITCKADGERALLLIDQESDAFLFTSVDKWRQLPRIDTSAWSQDYKLTILDGEYDGHRFYAFDLVVLGGRTTTDLPLRRRIQILEQVQEACQRLFEVKEYRFVSSLADLTKEAGLLLSEAETSGPYTIDGLVMTPATMLPDYRTKTWRSQLKWKIIPTVDAQYAFNPEEKRVYVSGHGDELIFFMPVDANLYPGRIAEFALKKNALVFLRLRPDKTTPNFLDVATDIMKSYKEPVTYSMMTGKDAVLPLFPKVPTISKRIRTVSTNQTSNKQAKVKAKEGAATTSNTTT